MSTASDLCQVAARHAGSEAIPRLVIHKLERPSELAPLIYEPSVCLILQGKKRTIIGGEVLDYGAGSCLVIAAELSALGQVTEATASHPFLAAALSIDTTVLSDVIQKTPNIDGSQTKSFALRSASDRLIDTWGRLLTLLERPEEIPALAPLCEHELLYRLLIGPIGPLLRQIGAMAELAGMSLTTFHRRFKTVTGVSPLQYQKQIRLHEAKRCLVAREGNASSIAFRVGYESTSQFSREYRRLFGMPPMQDAAAARELAKITSMF
ncbi:MAG: AraC family transcriptional regulator [Pseudomonadota bacterium]